MSNRDENAPGAASGAEVRKDGSTWTLDLVAALEQRRDGDEEPRHDGSLEGLEVEFKPNGADR